MIHNDNKKVFEWAVEITKAYYGNGENRSSANNPQEVSAFIQEIYDKLVEINKN